VRWQNTSFNFAKRWHFRPPFLSVYVCTFGRLTLAGNGWQLPEGGDFEALHWQSSTNFHRSTMLDLTTEPTLLGRCCYAFVPLMFY